MADFLDELRGFLEEQWDPDLTVREWWERLGGSGWAAPGWPVEHGGKALSPADAARVYREIDRFGALGPPGGLGMLLAGPTIFTHGTDEQKQRFLPDILTGRVGWAQLFSEPGAGSDLAGLQTRAVLDGDEWVVNGQKVWTSNAHIADMGMLLARTDVDVPKHKGISYLLVDMHQPGIEVRPLRELTGRALFNEVFLTDVRVPADNVLGGLGNGWAVTNTTLAFERAGLGAGGGGAVESGAVPGTVVGHLDRRAGDLVRRHVDKGEQTFSISPEPFVELARRLGRADEALVRQGIVQLHIEHEMGRFMALRHKAVRQAGGDIPGMGNMAKLRMSTLFRMARDVGTSILGPRATLHSYDEDDPSVGLPGNGDGVEALAAGVTGVALWSPGPSIYGGTDQIQRNILGERVLGLPREPGDDRTVPFRDLRKNA